ncbi:hypothetical protein NL108_011331 [Boleophthalmus pectinirostris]|uniref:histone-lysine N-methyltransferase 2B-like n=1 Tax=Boleophthalmus pectinirostris TaxID=150288 RepID=UPI00243017D7|nr:histone-lysine N-methyltransferase 2B-like [Boleophthalmus pectinirostris]KAJ0055748.1 hypothetical protein NL108_011331 [Boleophthalmus pectinirostris]
MGGFTFLLDHRDFVPEVAVQDPLDLEDQGELEVGGPWFHFGLGIEEDWNDGLADFGLEDWERSDAEEDEEEDEEEEERRVFLEDRQIEAFNALARLWAVRWMLPVRAVEPEDRVPTPPPQPQAPSSPAAPHPPPVGPALDFIPRSGHKRVRDEDNEEQDDPSSKRPCLSTSHPGPSTSDPDPTTSDPGPSTSDPGPTTSDPGPSTSSGTPGRFRFHYHHLFQDSESDED